MAPRPPGSIVQLTDKGPAEHGPEEGDVLETSTGRRYLIAERSRLGRRGWRFSCVVMDPADPYPEGSVRFSWRWDPRPRRRPQR